MTNVMSGLYIYLLREGRKSEKLFFSIIFIQNRNYGYLSIHCSMYQGPQTIHLTHYNTSAYIYAIDFNTFRENDINLNLKPLVVFNKHTLTFDKERSSV